MPAIAVTLLNYSSNSESAKNVGYEQSGNIRREQAEGRKY